MGFGGFIADSTILLNLFGGIDENIMVLSISFRLFIEIVGSIVEGDGKVFVYG